MAWKTLQSSQRPKGNVSNKNRNAKLNETKRHTHQHSVHTICVRQRGLSVCSGHVSRIGWDKTNYRIVHVREYSTADDCHSFSSLPFWLLRNDSVRHDDNKTESYHYCFIRRAPIFTPSVLVVVSASVYTASYSDMFSRIGFGIGIGEWVDSNLFNFFKRHSFHLLCAFVRTRCFILSFFSFLSPSILLSPSFSRQMYARLMHVRVCLCFA